MKASTVMLVAIGASIIGRWSNNSKVTGKAAVEGAFAVIVIAMLDQGKTEPIAKGFAWLFLTAVLLGQNSPLTGLAKVGSKNAATAQAVVKTGVVA